MGSLRLYTIGIIIIEKLEEPTHRYACTHTHVHTALVITATLHSDDNSSRDSVIANSPHPPGDIGPET